jgi:hypothetical protein
MRARVALIAASVAVAFAMACGARQVRSRPPHLDRSVLTREQLLKGHFTTLYDAVEALRSTWLRPRGVDSFVSPSQVWVYVDDSRLGGVETLRNIQPGLVNTVRFYDGPSATGRWGVDNGAGVIHVSTWNDGALGFPAPDTARRKP